MKPSGSFTRSAACVYLHAVKRILADARAVTQLTAGGRGLIKVPPHFFAVRPVRRLQRLVVLRADAGAEGIDIGSHWLPGFDGLGEM